MRILFIFTGVAVLTQGVRLGEEDGQQSQQLGNTQNGNMIFDMGKCPEGVHMISDIEGDYMFMVNWIDSLVANGAATNVRDKQGDPQKDAAWGKSSKGQELFDISTFTYAFFDLADGHCLANLGDMLDNGVQGDRDQGVFRTTATFLKLKEAYPDRVKLLLGNRDLNKIRIPSETNMEEGHNNKTGPFVYHSGPGPLADNEAPLTHGKENPACRPGGPKDLAEKALWHTIKDDQTLDSTKWLKWMLKESMGATASFAAYKQELGVVSGNKANDDDDSVANYIIFQTSQPGGLFYEYLKQGGVYALAGSAILVHGNVGACIMAEDGPGFVAPGVAEGAYLGLDLTLTVSGRFGKEIDRYNGTAKDAVEFVNKFHTWKQARFHEFVEAPNFYTDASGCGTTKLCRGGGALLDWALAAPAPEGQTSRNAGFSRCSINMPNQGALDVDTASFLVSMGIDHVFTGHIPIGAVPRSWTTETSDGKIFRTMNMDVTYAHPVMVRDGCQPGADGGDAGQRCIASVSTLVTYRESAKAATVQGKIAVVSSSSATVMDYAMESDNSSSKDITTKSAVSDWAGPGTKNSDETITQGVEKDWGSGLYGGYRVLEERTCPVSGSPTIKNVLQNSRLWKNDNDNATAESQSQNEQGRMWCIVSKFLLHVYVDKGRRGGRGGDQGGEDGE